MALAKIDGGSVVIQATLSLPYVSRREGDNEGSVPEEKARG